MKYLQNLKETLTHVGLRLCFISAVIVGTACEKEEDNIIDNYKEVCNCTYANIDRPATSSEIDELNIYMNSVKQNLILEGFARKFGNNQAAYGFTDDRIKMYTNQPEFSGPFVVYSNGGTFSFDGDCPQTKNLITIVRGGTLTITVEVAGVNWRAPNQSGQTIYYSLESFIEDYPNREVLDVEYYDFEIQLSSNFHTPKDNNQEASNLTNQVCQLLR